MAITNLNVSKLFGLAAGRCSICGITVIERDVKIGEMAHIIAKRQNGARGFFPVQGDINGYDNLILLCPNHHTEVDNNEAFYTPEKLHAIKDQHEAYVHSALSNQSQARLMDTRGLSALMNYLPLTRINSMLDGFPSNFNMNLFDLDEVCTNFRNDFPQCSPFSDKNLETYFMAFWTSARHLSEFVCATTQNNIPLYLAGENPSGKFIYLNRDLNHEEREANIQYAEKIASHLIKNQYGLIQYIKKNYPEVNLDSLVKF